ncbi:receptor-binding cancer antigen expressed on SiSo cells-like isoform X2 [Oculina patagonica]
MKIVRFNFGRFFSCFSFFISFIKRILFRGRQRKSSQSESGSLLVTVGNDSAAEKALGGDEWEEWGQVEEFSVKVEPSSNSQQTPAEDDLFHDMTPVFQKPKKIVVKKKKVHSDENYHVRTESPASRLNFDVSYTPVEPELGTWNDESMTAWDEEAVSEKDIEWQTEKLMKERKQAERERRAIEQQRRKEEREAHKHMEKKSHGHLGVRLSSS